MQARDVMTERVITVTLDTPVTDVAKLLLEKEISGVPVEDAEGHLIGMISEADLMHRVEIGPQKLPEKPERWWITMSQAELAEAYKKTQGLTAREVMHEGIYNVSPEMDLVDVVEAMERHAVKRMLVMEDGRLRGIVTRSNLLRGFLAGRAAAETSQSDRAVRKKIMEELRDQAWTMIASNNVMVVKGVASFWGCVSSVEQRKALQAAVEAIPGVKRVEDHTVLMAGGLIH